MKRIFFCFLLLSLAACSSQPSQDSIQTAIAQTQESNPTSTAISPTDTAIPPTVTPIPPTETPIPTETPSVTPSPTPDLRVIDIDPYKLLLQKSDCPPEGKYFLPGPDWTSPVTNSEIVSSWTVIAGKEYLAETGRIYGWLVIYKRGYNNSVLPEEIYNNVAFYENATGAQLVITKYGDRRITEEDRTEIENPPLIGDVTRAFVKKDTDASGNTRVSYMVSFSYRNIAHTVMVWGWEKEVSLDIAVSVAQTLLDKLKQLPLSSKVTFKP